MRNIYSLEKSAASWETQPGFVDVNIHHSPLGHKPKRSTEGEDEIKERWKRKKDKKVPSKKIYQLNIDAPCDPRKEDCEFVE